MKVGWVCLFFEVVLQVCLFVFAKLWVVKWILNVPFVWSGFAAAPSVIMLDRCGHGCNPNSDSECPHALDDDAVEVLLYACTTIGRGEQLLLDYGEEYRGHDWSQAEPQQVRVGRRCEHGRRRYHCKECGGAGICKHNRRRSQCKECGGAGICKHNRRRYECKECGGASICKHNRRRYECKECGGAGICKHSRVRSQCKECGGSSICKHNQHRRHCKECGGASICKHNRRRAQCKECGGASI